MACLRARVYFVYCCPFSFHILLMNSKLQPIWLKIFLLVIRVDFFFFFWKNRKVTALIAIIITREKIVVRLSRSTSRGWKFRARFFRNNTTALQTRWIRPLFLSSLIVVLARKKKRHREFIQNAMFSIPLFFFLPFLFLSPRRGWKKNFHEYVRMVIRTLPVVILYEALENQRAIEICRFLAESFN